MGVEAGGSRQDVPTRARDWKDDDPTVELGGEGSPRLPVPPAVDREDGPAVSEASRAAPGDEPLARGTVLRDRYRIEGTIGGGGQSIVYRARDLRLEADDADGAWVAIKALRPEFARSGAAIGRLKAEFRALRSLACPGVVRVFDLDRDGTTWFQVMELLEGHSLAGLLRDADGQAAPAQRGLDIFTACAEALAAAHEQGLVHGDVKPGNIFVTSSGSVRLLDFGTASGPEPEGGAVAEASLATPAYASPQVLSGARAEARDDLFSLCCVACELLTGRHPFDRLDSLEAQRRGLAPACLGALDAATAAALERGLAWERAGRPATIRDLLRMMSQGSGSTAMAAAQPAPGRKPDRRFRRSALWIVALVLLVLAAMAAWLQGNPEPAPPVATEPTHSLATDSRPPADAERAANPQTSPVVPAPAPEPVEAPPDRTRADAAAASAPAQLFTFETATVSVSRAASAAALRLRREGPANGRATVSWRIVEGSARAGIDFSGPTSGTLNFADGQTTSTLFVPLLGGSAEDASFRIEVTGTSRNSAAGAIPAVTVHIRRLMPAG